MDRLLWLPLLCLADFPMHGASSNSLWAVSADPTAGGT